MSYGINILLAPKFCDVSDKYQALGKPHLKASYWGGPNQTT
jgi:hypothetical protein